MLTLCERLFSLSMPVQWGEMGEYIGNAYTYQCAVWHGITPMRSEMVGHGLAHFDFALLLINGRALYTGRI